MRQAQGAALLALLALLPPPLPLLPPPVLPKPALCARAADAPLCHVRRVLGTGHYGVTYLCSSLATGQHVAVKALDKLHPEYERAAAVAEIRILAMVRCRAAGVLMWPRRRCVRCVPGAGMASGRRLPSLAPVPTHP